jgi:hypothetical protein
MAHMIVKGIDRMASTQLNTVWHAAETAADGRLTQVTVTDPETTLLTMAGIVWPTDHDNDVARTVGLKTTEDVAVTSHMATVAGSGRVLGIVGADYTAVPFRVILTDWLLGLVRAGGKPETLGTFDAGANMFASVAVADEWRVPGDDSITRFLCNVISNHKGEGGIRASFSTVRVVCKNTDAMFAQEHNKVQAAEERARRGWVTVPHKGDAVARMADAVAWITDGKARAESEQAMLSRMASKLVSPEGVSQFIDRYIALPADANKQVVANRTKAREQFIQDMQAADLGGHGLTAKGITAYGLLQAVTHFEDWTSTVRATPDAPVGTRRAFRAFLGKRQEEKVAAREHILSLVA